MIYWISLTEHNSGSYLDFLKAMVPSGNTYKMYESLREESESRLCGDTEKKRTPSCTNEKFL